MIDWNRVNELRDEIGRDDFAEVVDLFLEEVEQVIGKLRDAPDFDTLGEDLHFLKGSALNLGFRGFSILCQAGETASGEGTARAVDIGQILNIYDQSKTEFQKNLVL
ncbi:Hpt domain-containing protein [Shimia gijangensis]|uniref:Hpt domain-containing protein n=1 Tax=Shimia gijangensis TaxID=1470563 RepID=A0A1M6MQH5_9RHOB|nr:Hpt domain-containing protein [Shimia gijangensis]SHJ85659.1 Hpt domain-containing protein [Shimia gijangensis]